MTNARLQFNRSGGCASPQNWLQPNNMAFNPLNPLRAALRNRQAS